MSASRKSLVLLHGLGRTRLSLWPVARAAARRGYKVHNLGYPSRSARIEQLAEEVGHRILAVAEGGHVDVVTHSMGGIVLRAAVALGVVPALALHRVVMLAPPNQGSELAHRLRDFLVYRLATGPAGQQIGTGDESVPRRLPAPPFELGVIAGRRSNNRLFGRVLDAESDGKVTVASAQVDGMRELVVVDRAHTFIMWAPDVLAHTFSFLEHGPSSVRCHREPSGEGPSSSRTSALGRIPRMLRGAHDDIRFRYACDPRPPRPVSFDPSCVAKALTVPCPIVLPRDGHGHAQ